MQPVLVTTEHKGVFFGYVEDEADLTQRTLSLKKARCAIYWNTTKGFMELASDGPNEGSKIGSEADIPVLHDITAVVFVTPEAEEKWIKA